MSDSSPACGNCGAVLAGPFCATCGQRALPPDATLVDLARDAWHELSGYDGRFVRTLRVLLSSPGRLTSEVLAGRRARYIAPIRLYLVASFTFFLIAAIAPPLTTGGGARVGIVSDEHEQVFEIEAAELISAEDRARGVEQLAAAPWWVAALLRPVLTDPAGFRQRLITNMPRVLFVLVPVFALVVGWFFRAPWLQHAIFSLHTHAAVFLMLIPREIARFTGNVYVLGAMELVTLTVVLVYAVLAAKRVYAVPWGGLMLRAVPVAAVYLMAYGFAILVAIAWSAAL